MQACIEARRSASGQAEGAAVPAPAPAGRTGRARTGKIARLPHATREELNERLRDGLSGAEITAWLNSLPIVRAFLEKHFRGSPITEDNVSKWRHGGYAGWLEHEQTTEAIAIMAAACRNIGREAQDALTDQLALVLKARMVLELRKFDDMA
jgi:hypothetical protein